MTLKQVAFNSNGGGGHTVTVELTDGKAWHFNVPIHLGTYSADLEKGLKDILGNVLSYEEAYSTQLAARIKVLEDQIAASKEAPTIDVAKTAPTEMPAIS